MKNLIILLLAIVIAIPSTCSGIELRFSWTPNPDNTEGYRMVMDTPDNVIQEIPGIATGTTTVEVYEDTVCHSFALRAYNGVGESGVSNFVTWCPEPPETPAVPQQYRITVEPL